MSDTRSFRNAGSQALSPREVMTTAEILKRTLDRTEDEGLRRTLSLMLAKFGQAAKGLGLAQRRGA
jgi:hypothetical protein